MMTTTKTQIAGFEFDNCLMNAAGVACMTVEELEEVKNSAAGTFVTKTATLDFRQGNPEPRYQDVPLGSINSMGLPNNGLDYYLDYLLELQESEPDRTFFLSLVGMSPDETHTILKKVQASDFKGITELNLSCPNVPGKPQIAYDFETTAKILSEVFAYFTKPLGDHLLSVPSKDSNISTEEDNGTNDCFNITSCGITDSPAQQLFNRSFQCRVSD